MRILPELSGMQKLGVVVGVPIATGLGFAALRGQPGEAAVLQYQAGQLQEAAQDAYGPSGFAVRAAAAGNLTLRDMPASWYRAGLIGAASLPPDAVPPEATVPPTSALPKGVTTAVPPTTTTEPLRVADAGQLTSFTFTGPQSPDFHDPMTGRVVMNITGLTLPSGYDLQNRAKALEARADNAISDYRLNQFTIGVVIGVGIDIIGGAVLWARKDNNEVIDAGKKIERDIDAAIPIEKRLRHPELEGHRPSGRQVGDHNVHGHTGPFHRRRRY